MKRNILVPALILIAGSLALVGCSSSPTREELNKLESTRAEITSLSQRERALTQEKITLQQTIKNQRQKLQACQDDTKAVELKLKIGN